jgi:hypothetical protein
MQELGLLRACLALVVLGDRRAPGLLLADARHEGTASPPASVACSKRETPRGVPGPRAPVGHALRALAARDDPAAFTERPQR